MTKHKASLEDFDIPLGVPSVDPYKVFSDIKFQEKNHPADVPLHATQKDKEWAEQTVQLGVKETPAPSLAAERYLKTHFGQYNFDLPTTQGQWQNFVLTKLVGQANDPDPKISKPALDTLAKTSTVGLMVDRTELSITHRSSEDLEKTLKQAMQRYLNTSFDGKTIEGEVSRA
jgi:hypothetical protein